MNMEAIFAVMNTTQTVVKIRPGKKKVQARTGFEHMTSLLVSWWLWVQFPYWPEFFSGLVLTIG